MAVSDKTKALMWILTGLLLIGIIITYYNLKNKDTTKHNKYAGLVMICIGFFGSIYVAVNAKEKEGFSAEMKNVGDLFV